MGWAVGMITTALIMRLGPIRRSAGVGAFRFSSSPFCAVFLSTQHTAEVDPADLTGYSRDLRLRGYAAGTAWRRIVRETTSHGRSGLNVVYLIGAGLFFNYMF